LWPGGRVKLRTAVRTPAHQRFPAFLFLRELLASDKFRDGAALFDRALKTLEPHRADLERVKHTLGLHPPQDIELRHTESAAFTVTLGAVPAIKLLAF
jgi:hypothetical protein